MAIKQLPKRYHPDFRLPNKKPIGDVDIDWSNPLTKDLRFYVNVNNPRGLRNLVDNLEDSTLAGSPSNSSSPEGQTVIYASGQAVEHKLSRPLGGSTTTMMWYSSDETTANSRGLMCLSSGTTAQRYLAYAPGTTYTFFTNADGNAFGFTRPSEPIPSTLRRHVITAEAGSAKWYIDGVLISEDTSFVGVNNTSMDTIGLSCWETTTTSNNGVNNFSEAAVWDRVLTQQEITSLQNQPYSQILKPKQAPRYFTADSGGGTTSAITIPKPAFSSTAQSIAPIFNAAVSFTVSKPVFSSTAQSVAPIINGDASLIITKPVFASTAQSLAPVFNADVDLTIGKPVFASTAESIAPIVSGSIAFAIGKPVFSASAQAIPAGAGANANVFISKPVFASTAQSIAPVVLGSVAFSIGAPIFSATGQALGPDTNADASLVISKPQFNAAAQSIGVDNNAAISFNITSPIFSIFAGGALLEYYYAKDTQITLIEKSTIITAPYKSRTLGV